MTAAVVEHESQETVVRRLEADIAEVAGVLNAAHGRLVDLASELLESDAWRGIGVKSPEHWLVWHAGLSPHRARQVIAIARRRSELPVTCDTLTRGELSVDQVVEVAKHVPSHNDAEGASLAKVASVPQLRNTLSRYRFADPAAPSEAPESPEPAELEAVRKGTVSMVHDGDRFRLYVEAPLDDGALIESALAEAKDALFQQGRPGVTWMDALLEACNRSLSTVESTHRASRYRIYVHLDTDGSWLNQGPAIPPALAAKLVCDGVIQPLWDTSGAPVNGGRTDSANLACLCPCHHDALHRGELTIAGDADHPTCCASPTASAARCHRRSHRAPASSRGTPIDPGRQRGPATDTPSVNDRQPLRPLHPATDPHGPGTDPPARPPT